jgi:hypothetical protein
MVWFSDTIEIQTKKIWISNCKISLDHFIVKCFFLYKMVRENGTAFGMDQPLENSTPNKLVSKCFWYSDVHCILNVTDIFNRNLV